MTSPLALRVTVPGGRGRLAALVLAVALAFDLAGCALRSYEPAPLRNLSTPNANLEDRAFRLTTDKGVIVLVRPTVAFPFVEGAAERGNGRVELDLGTVRRAREFADDGWTATLGSELPLTPRALAPAGAPRYVEFDTETGKVRLAVVRVSETAVWGMPRGGRGRVRVDAREVTKLEVGEASASRGNWKTILVVVGVVALVYVVLLSMAFGMSGGTLHMP